MKKAVVLINKLTEQSAEDEWDVLDQACEVEDSLAELGYLPERVFMDLNLAEAREMICKESPAVVFNLVESVDRKGSLIFLAPSLLESMGIPYTGCGLESMFVTSNKMMAKKMMLRNRIPTPQAFSSNQVEELNRSKTYIAKPMWEDASVGITDGSVFCGGEMQVIDSFREQWGDAFFVEEYIPGREFNLSILGGSKGPQVLAPAEIRFVDFPSGKPHIVGYAAKWEPDSFEYKNTCRSFEFHEEDLPLLVELETLAYQIWDLFELRGYARVDFRVDEQGNPFVLEINANPCISPDAGFYAACQQSGITYTEAIERILEDAGV